MTVAINNKPTRLTGSAHIWSSYTVVLPVGTTIEQALDSDYWSHVASKFRIYDEIKIIAEDGAFVATLMVVVAAGTYIKVVDLWTWHRDADMPQAEAEDEGPQIAYLKFRGPVLKWCVLRSSDDECLKEKFEDKDSASAWLRDYIKTITR